MGIAAHLENMNAPLEHRWWTAQTGAVWALPGRSLPRF